MLADSVQDVWRIGPSRWIENYNIETLNMNSLLVSRIWNRMSTKKNTFNYIPLITLVILAKKPSSTPRFIARMRKEVYVLAAYIWYLASIAGQHLSWDIAINYMSLRTFCPEDKSRGPVEWTYVVKHGKTTSAGCGKDKRLPMKLSALFSCSWPRNYSSSKTKSSSARNFILPVRYLSYCQ